MKDPQMASQASVVLDSVAKKIEDKNLSMMGQRTTVLWLEYLRMVDILRTFIKGERTGNWSLHLQAMYDMLSYFAAAVHNLYAKSACLSPANGRPTETQPSV